MDREYFSNHLSGEIFTIVKNSLYDFLHQSFHADEYLDYFNNLSIATATGWQLDFIGSLMGFPRPHNPGDEITGYYLRYAQEYSGTADNAMQFSDEYIEWDYTINKGVFASTVEGGYGQETVPVSDSVYRRLLQALADVDCNIISLKALYAITATFLNSNDFTIDFDAVNPDSITLNVGTSIERIEGITAYAMLLSCYKGVYNVKLNFEE